MQFSPLSKIPSPRLAGITSLWRTRRVLTIISHQDMDGLHSKYGRCSLQCYMQGLLHVANSGVKGGFGRIAVNEVALKTADAVQPNLWSYKQAVCQNILLHYHTQDVQFLVDSCRPSGTKSSGSQECRAHSSLKRTRLFTEVRRCLSRMAHNQRSNARGMSLWQMNMMAIWIGHNVSSPDPYCRCCATL